MRADVGALLTIMMVALTAPDAVDARAHHRTPKTTATQKSRLKQVGIPLTSRSIAGSGASVRDVEKSTSNCAVNAAIADDRDLSATSLSAPADR
jgi:hypothetical protein